MRLIREDAEGLFVKTGGYVFRPLLPTAIVAGTKVPARALENRVAKVGDELWANTEGMTESTIIAYKSAFTVRLERQNNT